MVKPVDKRERISLDELEEFQGCGMRIVFFVVFFGMLLVSLVKGCGR